MNRGINIYWTCCDILNGVAMQNVLDEGSVKKSSGDLSSLSLWAIEHFPKHIEVEDQWIRQFWVILDFIHIVFCVH